MTASLARRALSALPNEPLYAILDGARDPRIRGLCLDSRAPAWCLYRGELPLVLEQAAPWLLRLWPGSEYTEQLFARGWGKSWGVLFATQTPSRELRRHLRSLLVTRTEEGKRLVFRYYDPRVLRVYLPTCTPEEAQRFFGPITAYLCESEKPGEAQLFKPIAPPKPPPRPAGRAPLPEPKAAAPQPGVERSTLQLDLAPAASAPPARR